MQNRILTRLWPTLIAAGLLLAGCLMPIPPTPTQSPTPVFTATASITPSPSPSLTPSPTPTVTQTPPPSPTAAPICTIAWAWREEGLVVIAVDPTRADGLFPGDLILNIGGRSAEELILEVEIELSSIGDPDLRRQAALDTILFTYPVMVLRVRHHQEPPYYFNLHPDCH